jgi:hypothetical protein
MLRRIMLCVVATAIAGAAASAADLPAQSRLGAVFAEPTVAVGPPPAYPLPDYWTVYAPQVDIPPLVAGYYGKPNSYYYSSYYGSSIDSTYRRLPYACGFYGYC